MTTQGYTEKDFFVESAGDGLPFDMVTCVSCGAFATHTQDPSRIKHYEVCKPGEAERWEKYYEVNGE